MLMNLDHCKVFEISWKLDKLIKSEENPLSAWTGYIFVNSDGKCMGYGDVDLGLSIHKNKPLLGGWCNKNGIYFHAMDIHEAYVYLLIFDEKENCFKGRFGYKSPWGGDNKGTCKMDIKQLELDQEKYNAIKAKIKEVYDILAPAYTPSMILEYVEDMYDPIEIGLLMNKAKREYSGKSDEVTLDRPQRILI